MAAKKSVLPWGLKEETLKPNSIEELSKERLKAFTIGTSNPVLLKTNVFQKKKEEKELKKELEAKETAKIFEDFVASFEEESKTGKAFVRGSVINPEDRDEAIKNTGALYQPTSQIAKAIETKQHEEEREKISSPSPLKPVKKKSKSNEKKKSILEMFGEELKRMQEERNSERSSTKKTSNNSSNDHPSQSSPFDKDAMKIDELTGLPKECTDPMTTNLYVGNINPKMTEEMLCRHFGKFGPLASVKIMWPRSDEEKSRNKNCGFVAFMRRRDAERALDSMKGTTILSYEVQIGWGKPVSLPPKPFYVAPDSNMEKNKFVPDPPSGLPFNAQPIDEPHSTSHYANIPPPASSDMNTDKKPFDAVLYNSIVRVVIPKDVEITCLIHRMIEFVIKHGPMFEAMIMNREMENPKFKFLFDNTSSEHIYYRWKLFSILQGDSPETWRVEDFRMFGGGSLWKPPSLKNLRGKVIPPIMEIVKRGQLSSEDRDIFEGMLREITMERSKIREGMVWCIDHAESAEEIADCLCESLTIDETLLPLKIARLYLLSDVLQNTSSKTASKYRRIFEGKLVPLIEHLHVILVGINSRLRAESFKRRVLKCFQAWDQLTVYHFNFVDKLRELFIGKTQEELEKKKAFETVAALISDQPSDDTSNDALIDNRPIDFSGGSDTVMFNPGGDIDGEPLPDLDVDGVPLGDPDIDGVPLDEDIDGIPMDATPAVSKVVQSKWETVDSSDDSSDQEKNRPKRKRENETASLDEEDMKMRQTLREVELKVLELVEALESSGNYTADEIAAKSSKFRNKLYTEAMDAKKKDKKQVDDKRRQSEDSPSRKRRTSSSDQRDKSPPHKKRHKSPSSRRKSSPDHHHRHRRRSSSSSRSPPRHRSRSPSSTHRHKSPSRKDRHRSSKSPSSSHKNKKSKR